MYSVMASLRTDLHMSPKTDRSEPGEKEPDVLLSDRYATVRRLRQCT